MLEAGGNLDVTVRVFPGLSHVFNHWTPGAQHSPALDAADPAVAHAIAEWVFTGTSTKKR